MNKRLGISTSYFASTKMPRLIWAVGSHRDSQLIQIHFYSSKSLITLIMTFTISFHGSDHAAQIGINQGPIALQFNTLAGIVPRFQGWQGSAGTNFSPDEDPLDRLRVAHEAEFDSYKDQHECKILHSTRTELLSKIQEWVVSPNGKCMFWLSGVAGTGKSKICRTVARQLKSNKLLAASFFFKRGEGERGNEMRFSIMVLRRIAKETPELK